MAELPTTQIVAAVYQLLPGFVMAWVFSALTAHPHRSSFERSIQALIFTALVRIVALSIKWTIGPRLEWSTDTDFVLTYMVALLLGLVFVVCSNNNFPHRFFPKWFSKRTAYASEWYSAFLRGGGAVYLHLKDQRRIFGWAEEFPDQPGDGHFILAHPEWIGDDNQRYKCLSVDRTVISAADVVMVEFEKKQEEWTYDQKEFEEIERKMIELQKEATEEDKDDEKPDASDTQSRSEVEVNIIDNRRIDGPKPELSSKDASEENHPSKGNSSSGPQTGKGNRNGRRKRRGRHRQGSQANNTNGQNPD